MLELAPAPTPFGLAVTADGRARWRAAVTIAGLPPADSLGGFVEYVAWVYTIDMGGERRLGIVRNGRTELGDVDADQFRIVITAERGKGAARRGGRIVLRATSPSALLLAHRDLMQGVLPGGGLVRPQGDSGGAMRMHEGRAAADSTGAPWRMPAMPPMAPMPGMHALRPGESPWLPTLPAGASIVDTRPRATIDLTDGDTLVLEASFVRRRIGGRTMVMYGFNGQQPGPLLRVRERATVVVRFRNRIDQPSTVHWHGVRLENAFDGVPGVTQAEVPPGGDFTYRVHFRDAGIYWYHPHVREDIQQELGLYGNMLVMPGDTRWYGAANREEVLALDDLLVDDAGVAAFGAGSPTHALMGRWGTVTLVNGEPRWSLDVRRGEVVRFFLTNVAGARTFNVSFPGARMKVVATDVGRLEREEWVESVVIAPAERWVVEVRFDAPGRVAFVNRVQSLDHMSGSFTPTVDTLGGVSVSAVPVRDDLARAFARLRRNVDVSADVGRHRAWLDSAPAHTLVLSMRTQGLPQPVKLMLNGLNVPAEWNDGMAMANWVSTGREVRWILRDAETGAENMDIRWRFRLGEVVKLRIYNDPRTPHAMAHPIHLHGQRFLVLARNGVPSGNLAWKDTAIVPAGETVDLAVEMSNPGRWAVHCHIAEHMGAGMMSVFEVR